MFLKETLEYAGFNREVTNPMSECQITSMIESNLGEAVNEASEWMIELNKERGQALQQRMKVDEIRFRNWHRKSLAELERIEETEVNKNGSVRKHIREKIYSLLLTLSTKQSKNLDSSFLGMLKI